MNTYSGKSLEEALSLACQALQVDKDDLFYEVIYEKKSLFQKKAEITAYSLNCVQTFIIQYLETLLNNMDFEYEVAGNYSNNRFNINIDTNNNSILIGKNGTILRSLNIVVKNAVNNHFKKRFEISLDINGYREKRYSKVKSMAIRFGKNVQRSRVDMKLDPMPADERKVIHQTLTKMNYVRTESVGEGRERHLVIIYDPNKQKETD